MEEKNNLRENLEKGKNNKTLIIVLIVLGIILLIGIVFCVINRNADNNKNNNDNSKDNDVVDKDNDKTNEDIKDNDDSQLKTTRYEISENNLYVSEQEKKYSDYQRNQKVTIDKNNEYYIENKKLYFRKNSDTLEVNIENETPKYLAIGADCGGAYVACLTIEGDVFLLNRGMIESNIKIYDRKDAKEFLLFSEDKITTTCGELSLYVILNDEKMLYIPDYQEESNYKTRNDIHSYSVVFRMKDDSIGNGIVLHPNGTVNKYMYLYGSKFDNSQEFITINDKDLLVSYIFEANEKVYIIDTDGIIYEVTNINDKNNEKTLIKLEKSNVINEKIKYVEVSSYVRNIEYRYKDIEVTDKVNQITLYGENGTKVEMIK